MTDWKKVLHKYRFILISLLVYYVTHLIYLTRLPIFNDESIYLDWAWTHVHIPGRLFDSLLDAKQPLMIWIFSIAERFFSDPLLAGRVTSVVIGSLTLMGLYKLAARFFNEQTAAVAALLYSVIPIFVFYNRQALMEAGVACVGVWSLIALISLLDKPTIKNGALLGVALGVGFFIKSSSLLFLVPSVLILGFFLIRDKKIALVKASVVSLVSILLVDLPLFFQPLFWKTFSSNDRYSYTLKELLEFPVISWFKHLLVFFEIGLVFVTPLVFLLFFIGMHQFWRSKNKDQRIFLIYFLGALLLEIIVGRSQSQRYLVPFLPFIVIPVALLLAELWKGNLLKKLVVVVSGLLPLLITLMMVVNPLNYIEETSKISSYADSGHIRGQTSGYGIKEAMEYISDNSSEAQLSMIFIAPNLGNPENAVDIYSQRDPHLLAFYIESQFFEGLNEYECFTSKYPAFFVTREDQLRGLDRFFSLEKTFNNPDGSYSVRIYIPKKECQGKTLSLSDLYQEAIVALLRLKSQ